MTSRFDPRDYLRHEWQEEMREVQEGYEFLRLRLRTRLESYPGNYATTLKEKAQSLDAEMTELLAGNWELEEWKRLNAELDLIVAAFRDIHQSINPIETLARLSESDAESGLVTPRRYPAGIPALPR